MVVSAIGDAIPEIQFFSLNIIILKSFAVAPHTQTSPNLPYQFQDSELIKNVNSYNF